MVCSDPNCKECVQVMLIKKDIDGLVNRFGRHETSVKEAIEDMKKTFKDEFKVIRESTESQWKSINDLKVDQSELRASQKSTVKYALALATFATTSGFVISNYIVI